MSNKNVPIQEFHVELSDLTFTGHDLVRPESIIAQPNGTLMSLMDAAELHASTRMARNTSRVDSAANQTAWH